jgi:hypothetical protein
MQTPLLKFVDSSFEHVLHSYNRHLISTYKYEIGKCLFDFISSLLNNHLSSFELEQNNKTFIIEYKKNPTMLYTKIKSKFFV